MINLGPGSPSKLRSVMSDSMPSKLMRHQPPWLLQVPVGFGKVTQLSRCRVAPKVPGPPTSHLQLLADDGSIGKQCLYVCRGHCKKAA